MTYNEFIQNILDTRGRFGIPDGEYKERHHIVPKCLGGTNDKENLIDGHVYCKECGEQLDNEPIQLLGQNYIFQKQCKCEREKQRKQKLREQQQNIIRLKENCFNSQKQWEYRFNSFQGEKTQAYTIALNYAKEFEEMKNKNIGLIFFGNVRR